VNSTSFICIFIRESLQIALVVDLIIFWCVGLLFNLRKLIRTSNLLTYYLYRYDFNGDGLISKEDVRIVLSYIPFKREANTNVQSKQNSDKILN
jgi:hypothetical protein